MKPADQPGAVTFVASGCAPLPVLRVDLEGGVGCLVSAWELTPEEMAEVARTGRVWLWIWGAQHPPVALETYPPTVQAPVLDQSS